LKKSIFKIDFLKKVILFKNMPKLTEYTTKYTLCMYELDSIFEESDYGSSKDLIDTIQALKEQGFGYEQWCLNYLYEVIDNQSEVNLDFNRYYEEDFRKNIGFEF